MYEYDWNPYAVDISQIPHQALQLQQGQQPQMAQAIPEQKYFGPAHEALSNYFSQSLSNQNAVPGLLNAMQNNPDLAQQVGGLFSDQYTPPASAPNRIDWAAAQDVANRMPQNFVGSRPKYKPGFEPPKAAKSSGSSLYSDLSSTIHGLLTK
ncbi:hypothetical protein UFOVP155_16 [uncultured Caudovirales phage]|uniref:Uncharacterized protein n=1 Tax=uncultured Caudovirales phage TaxID=2100421 RepID=A0A6J7WBS2_9CAUD|nr:hypothetical protein UFOVP155_16 [uncultured Caudovirales phage]